MRGDVKVSAIDETVLAPGKSVTLATPRHERAARVQSARRHQKMWIVHFHGVNDRDAADQLRGARLLVPVQALAKLRKGAYRVSELTGFAVVDAGLGLLGYVKSVRRYPSCDMLVVGERDALVPLLAAYGVRVELDKREIFVTLPAGFEELWR